MTCEMDSLTSCSRASLRFRIEDVAVLLIGHRFLIGAANPRSFSLLAGFFLQELEKIWSVLLEHLFERYVSLEKKVVLE